MNIFVIYSKKIESFLLELQKNKQIITSNNLDNLAISLPPKGLKGDISCNAPLILSKINKKKPKEIIAQKGLKQITDSREIEKVISKVIDVNADKVNEYKSGKDKLFGYFVGQVMQETKGKANPQVVNEILKKKLAK